MTRYRLRAVLLLFLLLNLTACATWQGVASPPSVADHIVAGRPERVRVTLQDGTQMELEHPIVSGDQLLGERSRTNFILQSLGDNAVSVPLADIINLEVQRTDRGRGAGVVLLVLGCL